MTTNKFIKLIKKIFPSSQIIEEKENSEFTPSEAGRVLSNCRKNKKNKNATDKNQLNLF